MARKNSHSRALRELAGELLCGPLFDMEFAGDRRDELETSLVRQWITYDGHATLFLGDRQLYLNVIQTPLGKPQVVPRSATHGWTRQLTEDWKVDPADLPEVFADLNRGQTAEVVNTEGIPLQLRVDPKTRERGVQPLVKETVPPGHKRDYRRIAVGGLEQQLGDDLDPDEMDALATSVARQWQRYDGHASIFLDGHEEVVLTITDLEGGGCRVDGGRRSVNLPSVLAQIGFPADALPDIIAQVNLGVELDFRDGRSTPCRLRYDPKAAQFVVERFGPLRATPQVAIRSLVCPHCMTPLRSWLPGQNAQTCPKCGNRVQRQ